MTPTDRRYTGQREVPAIGLYDYAICDRAVCDRTRACTGRLLGVSSARIRLCRGREEAVRLSERGDRTVRQVAEDLGVPEKALHRWRSEMRASQQRGARFAPGHGRARDEETERLKKENQQLRLERDILKKAMACLMPRPA